MKTFLLIFVVLPLGLVGGVRVALWLLRLARKHRGALTLALVGEELGDRVADSLEHWVDAGAGAGGEAHDAEAGEHHHGEAGEHHHD